MRVLSPSRRRAAQDWIHRSSPAGAKAVRLVHLTTVPVTLHFLRGQAAFLRAAGLEVHTISSPGPELSRFGDEERVPVHPVEMARRIAPLRDLAALWRVWRVLREVHPALVDAHTPKAGLLGMIAAALAGTPVRLYHLHGLRFATALGWRRQLLRSVERASCALADRVLAVSPSLRAMAIEEGLCRPDKIAVLLGGTINGIDASSRFRPQPDSVRSAVRLERGIPQEALVLGFVGRLARDKGIVELAGAWRQLRDDQRLHLLLVGGEDPTDAPPPGVMTELRGDPRVHFTGFATDMPPLYAAMDVLVLPSYREGFGQVALEGGAMTLPVVATAVTGCLDAVRDGITGTLVPPRNAAALAAAVRRYLDDAALRASHGEAARRRALAEFGQRAILEALAAEYRDLLRRASSGSKE